MLPDDVQLLTGQFVNPTPVGVTLLAPGGGNIWTVLATELSHNDPACNAAGGKSSLNDSFTLKFLNYADQDQATYYGIENYKIDGNNGATLDGGSSCAPGTSTYFRIWYTQYKLSVSSSTAQMATSSPAIINGFTHGELINGYFLLMLVVIAAYAFLYFWVKGIKIRP